MEKELTCGRYQLVEVVLTFGGGIDSWVVTCTGGNYLWLVKHVEVIPISEGGTDWWR